MLWSEAADERARKGLNQALYALRQELGGDEVLLGAQDLRLNPELITCDVSLFTAALKADRLEQAAAEYAGPFLDGFHLSDAPEFERWLEEERAELARDYCGALERLARRAADRGDRIGAVEWWRKLCAQDPLNARVAIGLMEALVAAGDRASALNMSGTTKRWSRRSWMRRSIGRCWRWPSGSGSRRSRGPRPPPVPEEVVPVATPPAAGGQADARTGGPPLEPAGNRARLPILWLVPAALVVGLGVGAPGLRAGSPSELQLGRISRITAQPGLEVHPALSPDGKLLAFAAGPSGQLRIHVRHLAGGRTIAVTDGTLGDEHWPKWSPDGARLVSRRAMRSSRPAAGRVGEAADRQVRYRGAGLSGVVARRREVAYAHGNTIEVVATEGDATTVIPTADPPTHCRGRRTAPGWPWSRQCGLRLRGQRDREHRAQLDLDGGGSGGQPQRVTDARRSTPARYGRPMARACSSSPIGTEAGTSIG